MPVHGEYRMQKVHAGLAVDTGVEVFGLNQAEHEFLLLLATVSSLDQIESSET